MFRFGVAVRDITPLPDMCVPGYFSKRFSLEVLDNLHAKAMAFENDGSIAICVVCDAINLNRDDVLRIRRGISENCGISEKSVSVSASHTHTGGPTWDWNDAAVRDPLYLNMLVSGAVDAATEAYKNLAPAKIGFIKEELPGYAFIRRFKMKNGRYRTNPGDGNPDIVEPVGTPDFSLIIGKVTDMSGKVIAFISNYGVHLDMVSGDRISADYPGELSRLIKEKYGEDVTSVFFTGPCGNTNHVNPTGIPVNEKHPELPPHKKTAAAMFELLCEAEKKISLSADVKPGLAHDWLSAKLRVPTPEYTETAIRYLHGEDVIFKNYGMDHLTCNQRRHIALATVAAYNNPVKMIDVEVMALTLGDTAIVTWPAEVFVEYGKAVRESFSGKNVIIAELSNGSFGCYLPTEEAIEQGGYEPTITGPFTPEPKIGTDMVNSTVKMLKELEF